MPIPDYRNFQHSNELYHYGMPRRSGRYPWGSGRNPYQSAVKKALKGKERSEYFRSERIIPKGTKMFRTTTNSESDLKKGSSTYVSYLDPDRDLYKGGYVRLRDKKQAAYEHEMVLEKDLKLPSRETVINTIDDVLTKNPKLFKQSVEGYLKFRFPENSWEYHQVAYDDTGQFNKKYWNEFVNDAYLQVKDKPVKEQWAEVARSFGLANDVKRAIIDDLKKKGYSAMVDEASVGGTEGWAAEGVDPLIIFDSSILSESKSTKISTKGEKMSEKKYDDWQTKAQASKRKNRW